MKILFLVAVVGLVLLGGAAMFFSQVFEEKLNVPIHAEYPGNVVYTSSQSVEVEALKKDCAKRGGAFNECGSLCGPDAEVCAAVCAFTCDNIQQ
jgi:hypothetical protein